MRAHGRIRETRGKGKAALGDKANRCLDQEVAMHTGQTKSNDQVSILNRYLSTCKDLPKSNNQEVEMRT